LYIINALLPLVYWLGVIATFRFIGLQAFADFKVIAFFIVSIVYLRIVVKLMKLQFWLFLWKIFSPAIVPVLFILGITFLTRMYLPMEKNKINLLIYFAYNGIVIGLAFTIYYFFSSEYKKTVNSIVQPVFRRIFKLDLKL
jgi:hypothetical protein